MIAPSMLSQLYSRQKPGLGLFPLPPPFNSSLLKAEQSTHSRPGRLQVLQWLGRLPLLEKCDSLCLTDCGEVQLLLLLLAQNSQHPYFALRQDKSIDEIQFNLNAALFDQSFLVKKTNPYSLIQSADTAARCQEASSQLLSLLTLYPLANPLIAIKDFTEDSVSKVLGCMETISQGLLFCQRAVCNKSSVWFSKYSFNRVGHWVCSALQRAVITRFLKSHQAFFIREEPDSEGLNYILALMNFIKSDSAAAKRAKALPKQLSKLVQLTSQTFQQLFRLQLTVQRIAAFMQKRKVVMRIEQQFAQQQQNLKEPAPKPVQIKKKAKNKKTQQPQQKQQPTPTEAKAQPVPQFKQRSKKNKRKQPETVGKQLKAQDNPAEEYRELSTKTEVDNIFELIKLEQEQSGLLSQVGKSEDYTKTHLRLRKSNSQKKLFERKLSFSTNEDSTLVDTPSRAQAEQLSVRVKVEKAVEAKLAKDLIQFTDSLSYGSNCLHSLRVKSYQKVRLFVQFYFPQAQVHLFGSAASGISLVSSDIDLLVLCRGEQSGGEVLAQLGAELRLQEWARQVHYLPKASVPVLKFEMSVEEDSWLRVDISFEGRCLELNYGYRATLLTKHWLCTQPGLCPLLIFLKHQLIKHELNKVYEGGLSSYALFIMVASYIKDFAREGANSYLLLAELLQFYAEQFQQNHTAVHLRVDSQSFHPTSEQNPLSLTVIDPLNGRNMTANAFQFCKIKQLFSGIKNQMLHYRQNLIQRCLQRARLEGDRKTSKKQLACYLLQCRDDFFRHL